MVNSQPLLQRNACCFQIFNFDGKRKAVWVEVSEGLYEKRMIMTGIENKTQVEITMGLKAGERVVTSGVYLINSEFILRNGENSMCGINTTIIPLFW